MFLRNMLFGPRQELTSHTSTTRKRVCLVERASPSCSPCVLGFQMPVSFLLRALLGLIVSGTLHSALAQEVHVVPLALPARQVKGNANSLRLLPADPELKDGNAAVVMLRMIWEQQRFMRDTLPKFRELAKLPHDDPRIQNDFNFDGFEHQLRRAAYMRDADWNYPIGEEQLSMILLPDAQGLRAFVRDCMSVWIGQQIANGNLKAAREGILVQLACARHMAKTPFVITQLIAVNYAEAAFDSMEILVRQPSCPNMYWALAMLPDSIGDSQMVLDWQARMVPDSLPSLLGAKLPEDDDHEARKRIADEFSSQMQVEMQQPLSENEAKALRLRILQTATKYLAEEEHFTQERLSAMSLEAIGMRWVLAIEAQVNSELQAAFSLAPSHATKKLAALKQSIQEMTNKLQAPATPFIDDPVSMYLGFHQFDRRVKFLQTAEAIRDYAARNNNQLPTSLDALFLPAPADPLTEGPFEYTLSGSTATLRMPLIPDIDVSSQKQRVYEITLTKE